MGKFLVFVVAMVGVLFLSSHYLPGDFSSKVFFTLVGVQFTGWLLTVIGSGFGLSILLGSHGK